MMSQSKSKRDSIKRQTTSKSTLTKQKPKLQLNAKRQPTTIARNLMKDFIQVEHQMKSLSKEVKKQEQSVELTSNQEQQSELSASIDHFEQRNVTNIQGSSNELMQLPRSYILAMKGLQEAVQYRDKQNRRLKNKLKQKQDILLESESLRDKQSNLKQIAQKKSNQAYLQITFLKSIIADLKKQAEEQIKSTLNYQNQWKLVKSQNDKLVLDLKKQKQATELASNEVNKLKEQIAKVKSYLSERKIEFDEAIRKRNEESIVALSEISALKVECSKLRDEHEKDLLEITSLRSQITVLKQSLLLQQQRSRAQNLLFERNQLDKIELQMVANREMLKEITFNQNKQQKKEKDNVQEINQSQKQRKIIGKGEDISLQPFKPNNNIYTSNDQNSSFRRNQSNSRSVSRLRQTNDSEHPQRRQLIGQMRQLMRHEKELVSLNYQMQVLQRGMMSQNSVSKRDQMQKTYCKLRKNIERKQIEVKQLKHFLDNPLRISK